MTTPKKHFFAEIEENLLNLWASEETFKKSLENRKNSELFTFYDGPPFANGLPHYGHLVSSIVKDAIPRYKTMRGYHVPRRFGWDCHGLPAEMKAEQDLNLGSKAAIEEYGVEKFVDYCRSSVLEFTKEWETYIERIGRWVDFKDNYYTMDTDYTESVMWAFKQLWDKGLVNKGYKVMPYCHVCETALSYFETRQDDSYRERVDQAVTVRFSLETGDTLLAWTTTPWTLPANLAVAIGKNIDYAIMEGNGERLVLSEKALERYSEELTGYTKVGTKKGKEFVGKSYEPLFDYFKGHKNAFTVLHADFVTDEDGTGIAHEAPAYGEEDQKLCEAHGIELVNPVDKQGRYTEDLRDLAGLLVFDANKEIINRLNNSGRLFKEESYAHSYPHCWRTDNPLIFRAVDTWIIRTTELKKDLLKNNQKINWVPDNVKDGAFGQWLEGVRDWNVSRDRYWGAPIPVWETDDGEQIVIGSIAELKKRAVDPSLVGDLHKPGIDKVIIKTDSGKLAHRVPEVFDCWFESGAMPFAQYHYPIEKRPEFVFPGDFIVEYVAQVRGWFYTLHVLGTALFDGPAFKNCVSHGVILGSDGRKLSKRLGNYPDLNLVFDTYGADAMRLYLMESPVIHGETIMIDEKAIQDVQRNVLSMLYNSFKFFKMYADVDKWQPPKTLECPEVSNVLDEWILSRLDGLITEVTKNADAYLINKAVRPLREFLDDLSNWYIRRSRRRFWKSENDSDKNDAYNTLYYVLLRTCQLLAPWAPFISDKIWRDLTGGTDLPKSVHLSDWPQAYKPNKTILEEMTEVRDYINEGLSQRAEVGIRVRQPLQSVTVPKLSDTLIPIITEELNVKQVIWGGSGSKVVLDTTLTDELKIEGTMRDLIRAIQNARKNAGLNVEDRIVLSIMTPNRHIMEAVDVHKSTILAETLGTKLESEPFDGGYSETVDINDDKLDICLIKAK